MPVVTIGRQLGSLGDEIGETLAEQLHLGYLDHHTLVNYVREFGDLEPNAPEVAETRPSFWERLNEERRRHAIVVRSGVYGFARDNDAVIVGLGANCLLRDVGHVLRVLTVAPATVRAQRVMEKGVRGQPAPLSREVAEQLVRRSDRERGGYIRYMYSSNWTDVHEYDMVLNTGGLTVEQATQIASGALKRADILPTAGSLQRIDDLALAGRVEAVLISHSGIWIHGLQASAERGVVTLAGEVVTDEDREYAEEAARAVPGVRLLVNELRIQPPPLTGM